jgi:hypothetical protein
MFIPDPDLDFYHPGSRGQNVTGYRIQIRNTGTNNDGSGSGVVQTFTDPE